MGFLLLIPTFRQALVLWFIRRRGLQVKPGAGPVREARDGRVIEGEFRREDEP